MTAPLSSVTLMCLFRRLDRAGGLRRQLDLVALELVHHFGEGTLKLLGVGFDQSFRLAPDFDVGIDAVAFDDPLAALAGQTGFGDADAAAVNQRPAIADADHAAPRTISDQRTKARLAEHRREDVAVRC